MKTVDERLSSRLGGLARNYATRPAGPRTKLLLRCSHEETARIHRAARKRGTTVSTFVMQVLRTSWHAGIRAKAEERPPRGQLLHPKNHRERISSSVERRTPSKPRLIGPRRQKTTSERTPASKDQVRKPELRPCNEVGSGEKRRLRRLRPRAGSSHEEACLSPKGIALYRSLLSNTVPCPQWAPRLESGHFTRDR